MSAGTYHKGLRSKVYRSFQAERNNKGIDHSLLRLFAEMPREVRPAALPSPGGQLQDMVCRTREWSHGNGADFSSTTHVAWS